MNFFIGTTISLTGTRDKGSLMLQRNQLLTSGLHASSMQHTNLL